MAFSPVKNALFAVAALAAMSGFSEATAQVTINFTTPQQTACVATTDVQGLTLVPGSSNLQATGVNLSGAGCGTSGGGTGSSNFATAVSAPAAATAGTPFNVIWSASSAATTCTYAGTAGASGWPAGATACTGSACAGSHTAVVNVTEGGSHTFAMSCTNGTGFGRAPTSVAALVLPPSPANFPLNVPSSVTVGAAFNVSWAVQNATSCTGTASLNGSSTTLSGWTDSTSASSPRRVTATQPGIYSLQLTCSNQRGSVTSALASTTSEAVTIGCPAGLQTSLQICLDPIGQGTACAAVDATQFANIWGRTSISSGATITPFPGVNLAVYFKNLDKSKYIAAKFTVPISGAFNPNGLMSQTGTSEGPNLTMKLSQTCGDFAADGTLCKFVSNGPSGRLALWKTPAGVGNACVLTPGQTYYANMKVTDPSQTDGCTANSCKSGVSNNNSPNP